MIQCRIKNRKTFNHVRDQINVRWSSGETLTDWSPYMAVSLDKGSSIYLYWDGESLSYGFGFITSIVSEKLNPDELIKRLK